MDVDNHKFNLAYHDFQECMYEAKRLSVKIQRCLREMLEAINTEEGGKENGDNPKDNNLAQG